MLQPFVRLNSKFINAIIKSERPYLVSQSYKRGADQLNLNKIPLLFTDYPSEVEAKNHYNAIRGDRYAAILNLSKDEHLKKIHELININSNYLVYWAVVKDYEKIKKLVAKQYESSIRRYIDTQTNWRIKKDTVVISTIEVTNGELYIVLKSEKQKIGFKFEEIEKFHHVL